MNSKWENYGDVNPIEHGGIWIQKDSDASTCYYVIVHSPITDKGDQHIFYDGYVDLTADWIDWERSGELNPIHVGDIDRVIQAVCYHGAEQFSGGVFHEYSTDNLLLELKERGITEVCVNE